MSIISWNCRGGLQAGLKDRRTVQELRAMVRLKSPSIIFLCETKCSISVIDRIKCELNYFGVGVDAQGSSGGMALLWNKNVVVNLKSYSDFYIDVSAILFGKPIRITGVYCEPNVARRRQAWHRFRQLHQPGNCPWLCLGDFNEVLAQAEFEGAAPRAEW